MHLFKVDYRACLNSMGLIALGKVHSDRMQATFDCQGGSSAVEGVLIGTELSRQMLVCCWR